MEHRPPRDTRNAPPRSTHLQGLTTPGLPAEYLQSTGHSNASQRSSDAGSSVSQAWFDLTSPVAAPPSEVAAPSPSVCGRSHWRQRAPRALVWLACALDVGIYLSVFLLAIQHLGLWPTLHTYVWILALGLGMWWIGTWCILSRVTRWSFSLGAAVVQIMPERSGDQRIWQLIAAPNLRRSIRRITLGGMCAVLPIYLFPRIILNHPQWQEADEWFIPGARSVPKESVTTPFFYVLGAWPMTLNGEAVVYDLPYQKGPPDHFVGRIRARLENNPVEWQIEGPKTPAAAHDWKLLKACIMHDRPLSADFIAQGCVRERTVSLERHVGEMQRFHPTPDSWRLRWFSVETPFSPGVAKISHTAQGIYLHAGNSSLQQDRFIFITAENVQQALILTRPNQPVGEAAFDRWLEILGSFRTFGHLELAQAWVEHALMRVNLHEGSTEAASPLSSVTPEQDHPEASDPVQGLDRARVLLLSKISVDPTGVDAFFHFAGTTLLLAQKLRAESGPRHPLGRLLRNVEDAALYAGDIAPQGPQTQKIRDVVRALRQLN